MRHISDGLLRRLVDEPFAATDSQQRHYTTCPRCQTRFNEIAALAQAAASTLHVAEVASNAVTALARVHARIALESITSPARGARSMSLSMRRTGGVLATAALLGALVAWSPVGAWAGNFITVFQPVQVTSVDLTVADMHSLAGLSKYGSVSAPARAPMRMLHSATSAGAAAGMSLAAPRVMPHTVDTAPLYEVTPSETASFTFSASKARAAAGPSAPPMPAHIDGSTLRVSLQPAVATVYGSSGNIPELVIGQMRAPEITSTGISVQELENYLLSLPDVPQGVADQIRAIQNPTKTLPIPIPVDWAHATNVTIQGVHGLAVGDNTGVGSGIIWERNGIIYGVAGPLPQDEVLAVANSLR